MGNKKVDNLDELDGIHLSFYDNHWILSGDKRQYTITPLTKTEDGKWRKKTQNNKCFSKIEHILPTLRKQSIAPIMKKDNRESLKDIMKDIENFHKWAKDNFKIKLGEKYE